MPSKINQIKQKGVEELTFQLSPESSHTCWLVTRNIRHSRYSCKTCCCSSVHLTTPLETGLPGHWVCVSWVTHHFKMSPEWESKKFLYDPEILKGKAIQVLNHATTTQWILTSMITQSHQCANLLLTVPFHLFVTYSTSFSWPLV